MSIKSSASRASKKLGKDDVYQVIEKKGNNLVVAPTGLLARGSHKPKRKPSNVKKGDRKMKSTDIIKHNVRHIKLLARKHGRCCIITKVTTSAPKGCYQAVENLYEDVGVKEEDKEHSRIPTIMEPSMSLASVDGVYPFKLTKHWSFTSSVGGVIDASTTNDPSAMAEWSSLTALFTLVRLRRAQYHYVRLAATATPTATTTGGWYPVIVNMNWDDNGTPGSYSGADDSPNYKIYNYAFDTSKSGITLALNFTGDHEPLWNDVNTPSSSGNYLGCPGNSQIYGSSQPVSTETIFLVQTLWIEMTSRS